MRAQNAMSAQHVLRCVPRRRSLAALSALFLAACHWNWSTFEGSRADGGGDGGASSVALGVRVFPYGSAAISAFTSTVGSAPRIVLWEQDWAHGTSSDLDTARVSEVTGIGATPMITWAPYDYAAGIDQPAYRLTAITAGTHDSYIQQYATAARNTGARIYLRFAPDMNATWFPWGDGVNGNTSPTEFRDAWIHVRGIFRSMGADNVRWVFSVSNIASSHRSTPLMEYYPGDHEVDWIGMSGLNQNSPWLTLTEIFGPTYDALAGTMPPMMISYTASVEAGGDKANWIRQGLLQDLSIRFPRIQAVIWNQENDNTHSADYRVDSSTDALTAFREVATSPRFRGTLP